MPDDYNNNGLVETDFVHLDGNEIVDGIKTFLQSILLPTPTAGDNSTKAATTAFIQAALAVYAKLASPTFTGTPKAPTAASNTNSTQIATTAFVKSVLSSSGNGFATYSKSGNGYIKFANGIIIQWGIINAAGDPGVGTVTLPTPFSNNNYRVQCTVTNVTDWFNAWGYGTQNKTTTNFKVYFKTSNWPIEWLAIGY